MGKHLSLGMSKQGAGLVRRRETRRRPAQRGLGGVVFGFMGDFEHRLDLLGDEPDASDR